MSVAKNDVKITGTDESPEKASNTRSLQIGGEAADTTRTHKIGGSVERYC